MIMMPYRSPGHRRSSQARQTFGTPQVVDPDRAPAPAGEVNCVGAGAAPKVDRPSRRCGPLAWPHGPAVSPNCSAGSRPARPTAGTRPHTPPCKNRSSSVSCGVGGDRPPVTGVSLPGCHWPAGQALPVWASRAKRSGTPQCSTIRPSTTRARSNTVMSTGLLLGGPKNGPVAVPRARTRTQMVSSCSAESSMVNDRSGTARWTSRMAALTCSQACAPVPGQAELVLYQVGGAQLVHDRGVAGGEALLEDAPHHVVRLGALPAGARLAPIGPLLAQMMHSLQ